MRKVIIKYGYFQDSLRLMRVSTVFRQRSGVKNAVAVMATEKAKHVLEDTGLITDEVREANGSDLVLAVEAKSNEIAERVIGEMFKEISAGLQASEENTPDLLKDGLRVINVGLDVFKDALEDQGVKTVHVKWEVPAKGDEKIIGILKKMC